MSLRLAVARLLDGSRSKLRGRPSFHVAVVGFPRGGTSLLHNMLSATLPGFRFDDFETRVLERLHRIGDYATKTPLDVLDLGHLSAANTLNKRIVVLAVDRDIRDVITSRHPNLPDRYFIGHDASWWPQNKAFSEWRYDAAGVIAVEQALRSAPTLSGFELSRIRYEDLVADPDGLQRRLREQFDLPFAGRFSEFHLAGKRRAYRYDERRDTLDRALVFEDQPASGSRQGKWRAEEHRARIIEQFSACDLLFDFLIAGGYEPDRNWFREFQSTSPLESDVPRAGATGTGNETDR